MAKSPDYRTSAAEFDGAMPILISSSGVAFATSLKANIAPQLVPFDAYIEKMWYAVETTSTATGTRTIDFGTATDDNVFIAGYVVNDNVGTRQQVEVDLTATTVLTRVIPAGSRVAASLNVGTAGGTVSIAMVLLPKEA